VTTPSTTPLPPPPHPKPKPAKPKPGSLRLQVRGIFRVGKAKVTVTGRRFIVTGTVKPYVPGQRVTVRAYRGKHLLGRHTLRVLGPRKGRFRFGHFTTHFSTGQPGSVAILAAHQRTKKQKGFSVRPFRFAVVKPYATFGSSGLFVRLIQSRLAKLHVYVWKTGVYDDNTGRAILAYRKLTGRYRTEYLDAGVVRGLLNGQGRFVVRYPGDGRHVEGDLTHQLLALINPGGQVYALIHMSSGKPSTPTVLGRFHVYSRDWGTNSEGMVDSSYWFRGYAVHGYHDVPTYAASHGCLRIPIPNAAFVFGWMAYGMPVDVYYR
jgi:hypothetical protein